MTTAVCAREGCGRPLSSRPSGRPRKWCSERCRKRQYDLECIDCGGRVDGTTPGRGAAEPVCIKCAGRHYAKWNREKCIAAILRWAREHDGVPPTVTDWNPVLARTEGHPEKAEKFYADGCWPWVLTVVTYCGGWNTAIAAAGFKPRVGRPRADD